MACLVPLPMNNKSLLSDTSILRSSQSYPWMFGMLVDRYQEAFLRKGLYILRSPEAAEDAVQETFLKIYKYAYRFSERDKTSFRSWAYKILVNTCYSHATKRAKDFNHVRGMDLADLDAVGSEDTLPSKERSSLVQSVLSRLPRNLSRLLSLYFFEEKSYEEIATLEHISISAVRSGLYRAKKQFKNLAIKVI